MRPTLRFGCTLFGCSLLASLVLACSLPLAAEEPARPLAVVAFRSYDELVADAKYLAQFAGTEDMPGEAAALTDMLDELKGVDKQKPFGISIAITDDLEAQIVAFLPVTDFQALLDSPAGSMWERNEAGEGVLELTSGGLTVYAQAKDGWAYFTSHKELLAQPTVPLNLMRDLQKDYDIGVRLFPHHLPEHLREVYGGVLGAIRLAAAYGMKEEPPEMRKAVKVRVEQLCDWLRDMDQVTLGFNTDTKAKALYVDLAVTVPEGSESSARLAKAPAIPSSFPGFLQERSLGRFVLAQRLTPEDVQYYKLLLSLMRKEALKPENLLGLEALQLPKEPPPDEQVVPRNPANDAKTNLAFDLMEGIVQAGRLDAAVVVLGDKSITTVLGAYAANGAAAEETLTKLFEGLKESGEAESIEKSAAEIEGVMFHRLKLPKPANEEDEKFLGVDPTVLFGADKNLVYLAVGADPQGALKRVLAMGRSSSSTASSFELTFNAGAIAAIGANPENAKMAAAIEAAEKAKNDRISLSSRSIKNGVVYRLEFEEGAIKVIAASDFSDVAPFVPEVPELP